MSSKQIKDQYGAFAEAARRETVVHTSHGRPTLVTISIDRARRIPELRHEIGGESAEERSSRLERLFALAGAGAAAAGNPTPEDLIARSRAFRGDD
jgi:hypothetical protein